jgi:16S rRNA (cytidine1402-2'-O)-methyltransferase
MLYLIATPIGNLEDITLRALKILEECDYILCEDTRHSIKLLNHYQIRKPLKSYHKFNEAKTLNAILEDLQKGIKIGLLSDAGTPGIADPGVRLVQKCRLIGIPVFSLPGPCAAIVALSSSGLSTDRFQFVGFLPQKGGKKEKMMRAILDYTGTSIIYESPYRILKTLKLIDDLQPERYCVIARELTKKFEQFQHGTARELLDAWKEKTPKGEFVLLISAKE